MTTLVITPLFLLAGTFFPIDQLPQWAQVAAQLNPLHQLVVLVRDASLYGFEPVDLIRLGVLVGFALVHVADRDLADDALSDRLAAFPLTVWRCDHARCMTPAAARRAKGQTRKLAVSAKAQWLPRAPSAVRRARQQTLTHGSAHGQHRESGPE